MALFIDGPPSSIDDLVQQDSYLLSVASTEGIDVSSKLQLAYDEVSVELTGMFGRELSFNATFLGQVPLDLTHLAVTPPLKLWMSFKALELVYRDAYFNQLSNRYQGKRNEYQSLANWGKGKFIETGAGLVIDPLPQPAPPISFLQPGGQPGGTTYFTLTLLNASGEESSPASVTQFVVPNGNFLRTSVSGWPSNATGWNFYCGAAPNLLSRQNSAPIILGTAWQFALPGTSGAQIPGTGQSANFTRDLPRRLIRG